LYVHYFTCFFFIIKHFICCRPFYHLIQSRNVSYRTRMDISIHQSNLCCAMDQELLRLGRQKYLRLCIHCFCALFSFRSK
jgi:hypothetical protein